MSRSRSSTGTRPVRAVAAGAGGSGAVGEGFACGGFSIGTFSLGTGTRVSPEAGMRRKGTDSLNATTSVNAAPRDLVAEVEALGERLTLVRERIGEVIFGQGDVIEQALITILSGGHGLLIGVPGLAKTRLVEMLGAI